jgi:oligopeptide transport system permease protein
MTDNTTAVEQGSSLWADAWKRLLKNRAAVVGGLIVAFMAIVATLYPVIERYGTRFEVAENHPCLSHLPPGARGVPRTNFLLFSLDAHSFADVDSNSDGEVSTDELSGYVAALEHAHLDRDDSGGLSTDDLRKAPRSFLTDDFQRLLDRYDEDESGELSVSEARTIVDIVPRGEAGAFVRSWDVDGDELLSNSEFLGVPQPRRFMMGTDALGRDVTVRMVYGARISLAVGLLATLVSFLIGVTWGATAGFLGGWVDAVMMRIVDILYGLPFMFLVILLMVVFGQQIILLFMAIGAVSWLTMSRIVRGQVISLKHQEFVLAAQSIGTSTFDIVFRHLIPNALGPIIVYATLTVPAVMLQEAFLSFLGLGVQAPYTSWGALASDGASPGIMIHYPWLILFPGLALAITLLALNFLGDGLRDALDPRIRKN